jgi:16S rRNA (uracil1498-N3)-methyltransferase
MIRLRVTAAQVRGDVVELTPQQRHYVRTVMRREAGARLVVLLPDGPRWATVQEGDTLRLAEAATLAPPIRPYILVAQALLKGDRVADAWDRATQAGAGAFQPVIAARSIVREVSGNRLRRWATVIDEAAEQCGRSSIPSLLEPQPLQALTPDGPLIVLHPGAEPLGHTYDRLGCPPRLTLAVGPEGGFTDAEIAWLTARGAVLAGLGPLIIRAENAAAFAVFWLTRQAENTADR